MLEDTLSIVITAVVIVAIIAIFYFVLIRPSSKRKKKNQEMQASVKVDDVITTIGGLVGTVCAVKDETIVIEIGADRVRVETYKWAISEINLDIDDIDKKK